MIVRNPWSTATGAVQAFGGPGLGYIVGTTPVPTRVTTADGGVYDIPTGTPGSFAWAREASLIAVAYEQAGEPANAYIWAREYEKRVGAWNQIQAGADLQAIIGAGSWLEGPQTIYARLAATVGALLQAFGQAAGGVASWTQWLPWLIGGALVVIGLGFNRGTLRVRR